MERMSTKYKAWFNYDNDKKKYCVPVLPEKIKLTIKGQTTSVDIDKLGELLFRGKRDAITISFSSYFPAKYGENYCSCLKKDFKSPKTWHKWILSLLNATKPCHFVLTGSPLNINLYADVVSYVPSEQGGDTGTIYYTVELKEHRSPTVRKYKKKSPGKKPSKTPANKRPSNKEPSKTYVVKAGDCLWNIAYKFYRDGTKESKIYNANKDVIEKTARKYGRSSSNNGWWIYPGTKLVIP